MQVVRHSRPVAQRLRAMGSRRTVVMVAAQQKNLSQGTVKTLHLMRHGTTEMNEYLATHRYDAEDFQDPMMYDTVLTTRGRAGAEAAARVAERLNPKPELLVVSPLTRALQTAQLAFLPHYQGPVLVEPLARERVWHASDIGSNRAQLERTFPDARFQFDSLPDVWWHCVDPANPREVGLEPEESFKERVQALRLWLAARPEQCIAVVAHWGLLYELTGGADFENCQIRTFSLDTRVLAEATAAAEEEGRSGGRGGSVPVAAALREQVPNVFASLFR
ncbi:hypothetical protein PLESTB_000126900 [Pleodorina starrii]|uniref:Phosphoglycerate mutase n=1 Tax=Pleodorina starrii TaxID=330485 RepID=A0A9W6BBM9_9CHLO|nr:hypothetical protein PLESTM_000486000 [Pleodorina starrii]GLC48697.1 hypothetical protein PLESTB_000126900 [Pleodorina starrii]GLC74248.1 hypothetical protein PLESTF_001480800 [Pleodorina starrii]